MEGESSSKKRATFNDYGFMDLVFSWSIEDILDEEFYKNK
ncbi:regulator of nonsense transcripts-like protein, partial [Trifolium medium]|nr:regulator of nonsense transcripts-like protein [Trifolium medium]